MQVNGKVCWMADNYLKSSTGTSTSGTSNNGNGTGSSTNTAQPPTPSTGADFLRGVFASVAINGGVSSALFLQCLASTIDLLSGQPGRSSIYMDSLHDAQKLNQILEEDSASKQDYYAGKAAADAVFLVGGFISVVYGIAKIVSGVGTIGEGAALSSTGGGAAVGIPALGVGAMLVVQGATTVVAGTAVAATAAGNLGDDVKAYFDKAECESKPAPPKSVNFSDKQLGKKYGEHRDDYPHFKEYTQYRDYALNVFSNPEKIIFDPSCDEFYYIQGKDLLRVKSNGDFVSLYPGATSPRVLDAIKKGVTIWP